MLGYFKQIVRFDTNDMFDDACMIYMCVCVLDKNGAQQKNSHARTDRDWGPLNAINGERLFTSAFANFQLSSPIPTNAVYKRIAFLNV